jgi:hypothetical protein
MTGMGNLSLMVSLLRARNSGHARISFFLKYHDHKRIIGASTRMDNAWGEQFLNNFRNFIFLGKGMTIGMNIGRKDVEDEGNGMCSVPKAEPRCRSCYMQRIVNMFYRLVSQVLNKL